MRWGGRAQNGVTIAQVVIILAATVAGLSFGHPERVLAPASRPALDAVRSPAFSVALVFVSIAYSGWNGAAYVAGEVRAPSRALPLSHILGSAFVTVLYVGLNVVFLSAPRPSELAGVVEVAHVAAERLAGVAASRAVSGLIALTLASSVGAMLAAGPRVCAEMGRDYRALAFLACRTSRGAPAPAVAAQAGLALVLVATASFGTLLEFIGFTLSTCAGLTVLGVFVLRAREPELARPYRAWGYPVTPALFIALSLWMVCHALIERPVSSLAGAGTILGSLLLYALAARAERRHAAVLLN